MTRYPEPVGERCLCGIALALILTALVCGCVRHMFARGGTGVHIEHAAKEQTR